MPTEYAPPGNGPAGADPSRTARSLFSKFRSLLESNTAALAKMAEMERMLGGEYIFDRSFLDKAAREVAELTHRTVYALNAMTGNAHVALYDRYMAVNAAVEDILAGRPPSGDEEPVRGLAGLRLEDRHKVGFGPAALGELSGHLGLPVPWGLALTAAAFDETGLTGAAGQSLARALAKRGDKDAPADVAVSIEAASGERLGFWRGAATPDAVIPALGREMRKARQHAPQEQPTALILAETPAVMAGQVRTLDAAPDGGEFLVIEAAPAESPDAPDVFYLERAHPFAVRRSRLSPKALDAPLPDGEKPLSPASNGHLRGTALLPFDAAAALAGLALAAERLLGGPLRLDFFRDAGGAFHFTRAAMRACQNCGETATPEGELILRGGEAACLGRGSGAVIHVTDRTVPTDFPFGAVAVTRSASPVLAPVLRRAGAMVAEVGDAAGHLAAVAREFRTPALFGLPGALAALPEGLVVTVDAEMGEVRKGASPGRVATEAGLNPDDPEYLTLRRLLRRIAGLNLTDPDAPGFTEEGCRTFHDLIHFSHEKAVTALAEMRLAGVSQSLAKPLALPVPLFLRVLDIGGGLTPGVEGIDSVRSRPLRAFLNGVVSPGMWDQAPARVGLREILGGMDRTMAAMTGMTGKSGGNLAIAARSYCNISLRLGYHFSVVDAYCGDNPDKNSVYFRFVGGMAHATARAARAAFLLRLLSRFDFKASAEGDLVVARLKMVEAEVAEAALTLLGRLTAFTRQRDVGLSGPDDVDALEADFEAAGRSA
ncbi:pyruvate phosphate dikinase PEP/pyruvate-binding [Solidesulfovibrio fructosivorans JJ]]|uniref:Pyruvate phosphate dikinase PEP/pyruvate-binding n=1 Tax=Solidesulfovibrio fructosivorans JJ] TaxID=596151 RepID=E1K186_SOLFR|nr:PEP-utilizing enzyme [Solidesulfovibrio fructosivorans]EFL49646.1 pyruvate phosphate dikinase PEP/pyruvate-binding [Solidesulfovibrio fructosivorans JJ]]